MISSAQIRAGRAMLSIKQKDLANAANVSLATLNNIERGLADPRSSTLEAIENALSRAGIECENEKTSDIVRLNKQARPVFYEPFQASQFILNSLAPDALIHPQRLLFFVRRSDGVGRHDDVRLALLIEGQVRDILIDHAGLCLTDTKRAAETAGVIYAAMMRFGKACYFHPTLLDDTTLSAIDEAIDRLKQQDWLTLENPFALLSLIKNEIKDWQSPDFHQLTDGNENHPLFFLLRDFVKDRFEKLISPPQRNQAKPDDQVIQEEKSAKSSSENKRQIDMSILEL